MVKELYTTGQTHFPGYQLWLWHNPEEIFLPDLGYGTRFRLILVEQGSGILQINCSRQPFIAPSLFCLSEQDQIALEQPHDIQAQGLYFHPSVINSAFTFDNVRLGDSGFSSTQYQDLSFLRAFVGRDTHYHGQLQLSLPTAQRLAELMQVAGQELAHQWNDSWPCRSRSFLLEILFVILRVISAPPNTTRTLVGEGLPAADEEVEPVIMHLHTHYHEKVTITTLSRTFHTNRTTLTERFRETTGVSVMTYLARLRIRMASSMLHDTRLPINEVAYRVGFNDVTHFGRTFRKYMGCTPSEYRERYCWMA